MNVDVTAMLVSLTLLGGVAQASAATITFDTVQFPGTGQALAVKGSDGNIFTFSATDSQFEAFPSGGGYFLTEGLGRTGPITVSFSAPLTSIALPVSSDRVGDSPYTTTVNFFDGASLVDTITKMGNTMNPAEVFSFTGAVTSAVITTSVAAAYAPFGYTQNLDSITYVSSVPLPTAAPMFGAALVILGVVGYRGRRTRAAAK